MADGVVVEDFLELDEEVLNPEFVEDGFSEVDISDVQVVERPGVGINKAVERYWEDASYAEYITYINDGSATMLDDNTLKLMAEANGLAGSAVLGLLFNPAAGLTAFAGVAAEAYYRMKKNRDRVKRIDNNIGVIETTYFFDGETDLSPIIENTEVFTPDEDYVEVYSQSLDVEKEVEDELDLPEFFDGTTQALWLASREQGFDYQLEVHFDGTTMFRANGYAETEEIGEIMDESDYRSTKSLIKEYTDTEELKRDDIVTRFFNGISRRSSYLPDTN